jgi:hypothetical protein
MSRTVRRPYSGSKRFDRTCRNHGACTYCRSARMHRHRKARLIADEKLAEVWLLDAPDGPQPRHNTRSRTLPPRGFEKVTSVVLIDGPWNLRLAKVTHKDGSVSLHELWAWAGDAVWTDDGLFVALNEDWIINEMEMRYAA